MAPLVFMANVVGFKQFLTRGYDWKSK